MKDFTFYNPTKIVFGKTALKSLPTLLKENNFKKIFLTFGKGSLKDSDLHNSIKSELADFECLEFWGIEPNPRVETIRLAVIEARKFQPDVILAVGGGSVIDGSKLLVGSYYSEIDPWELVLDYNNKVQKVLPLACILTVAATGTEMDSFAVITNWEKNLKDSFGDIRVNPKFSILNPEFTYTLSAEQTAYGIVDIFSHVCEQYFHTTDNSPIQDRFSESIFQTLIEHGPELLKNLNNYDLRSIIMWSSTMALNGIIGVGVNQDWATHGIEHEISAFYDIPHGAGLAILTPRWMMEVKEQKRNKLIQYGKRVWALHGNDDLIAENAIVSTYNFFKSLGIKMSLSEWNIDDKNFDTMIDRLVKKNIGEFPLKKDQISNILNNSIK
jgi:alcohol dehydrogenase YqhD (iron-dependent ADH family)